ncbi:unnamed protein product [Somion occarium]|uniref:Uncharacterized protein n=1 Tax=Somion occarium TaxID=3059160 RepID=A0ABP1EBP4_9APHY
MSFAEQARALVKAMRDQAAAEAAAAPVQLPTLQKTLAKMFKDTLQGKKIELNGVAHNVKVSRVSVVGSTMYIDTLLTTEGESLITWKYLQLKDYNKFSLSGEQFAKNLGVMSEDDWYAAGIDQLTNLLA